MEFTLKSSFVKVLGKLQDGIAILIDLNFQDLRNFEAIYWSNLEKDGLKIENDFLELFLVEREEELPFYEMLIEDVRTIVPDKEQLSELYNHPDVPNLDPN